MSPHDLSDILASHPFFNGLAAGHMETVVGCAANVVFAPGDYLFHEQQSADRFFLIREGRVAVELHAEQHTVMVNTLAAGEVLGWSWLVPPYRYRIDARAQQRVRALQLDGACLRGKCDTNPGLGYDLMKRLADDLQTRLVDAWMQNADLYDSGRRGGG